MTKEKGPIATSSRQSLIIVECPPDLDPVAREEWDRVVPELIARDLICKLDRAVLIAYCKTYSAWQQANQNVEEFGAVVKSPNGHPIQSPYVSIANKLLDTLIRLATELALSR